MTHFLDAILLRRILGGLCLFFILNPSSALALSDKKSSTKEILVIGTGPIADGNIANARKAAVSDALSKGVEEYLTRRLGSKGMMNNFSRIIHNIMPKAKDQVENFNILAEEKIDHLIKLLLKVKINENVIEQMLRETNLVTMEGPAIKILFLVAQVMSPDGQIFYWWKEPGLLSPFTPTELSLYRVFQERGFQPINRMMVIREADYSGEMKVLDLSDEMAIHWGNIFSADLVIHGRCDILKGKSVSITLRSINVVNGLIISQDTQKERIGDVSKSTEPIMEGIERALNHLVMRLSPEIIRGFENQETTVHFFPVILTGLRNFKQLKEFENFLKKDITGVKEIRQTRVKGNTVSISVGFLGNRDKFLGQVLQHENLPFQADLRQSELGEIIINIR